MLNIFFVKVNVATHSPPYSFGLIKTYACASRVELPDGNYELVPESGEEENEGGVNFVEVQQDPNQSSEDLQTNCASEGKHQSITHLF